MGLRSVILAASALVATAGPATAATYTVSGGGNSDGGILFDLSVRNQAITLQSLGIYAAPTGATPTATVYMRSGSYYGFSGSSDGWSNLGSFGLTKPLFNAPITLDFADVALEANSTYGFFVTLSGTSTLTTGGFGAASNGIVSLSGNALGKRGFTGFTTINRSFNGTINYAITPPPAATPPAATPAVPEPATWAMMVGGFGLVGGALRRRRRPGVRFA